MQQGGSSYSFGILYGFVVDLSCCEVEVSKGLRADDDDVGDVGLRGNPVDGHSQLSAQDVERLWVESVVHQLHIHCRSISYVEDCVSYNDVVLLDEVFIQDFLGDEEAGAGLVVAEAATQQSQEGNEKHSEFVHLKRGRDL